MLVDGAEIERLGGGHSGCLVGRIAAGVEHRQPDGAIERAGVEPLQPVVRWPAPAATVPLPEAVGPSMAMIMRSGLSRVGAVRESSVAPASGLTAAPRGGAGVTRWTQRLHPFDAEHFDVVIVGAGLSGIGAGYYLQRDCPGKSYRHPGKSRRHRRHLGPVPLSGHPLRQRHVHLGYAFKPWTEAKAIADGPSIKKYVNETAREYGIDQHIRFKHRVKRATWSIGEARWTVEAEHEGAAGALHLQVRADRAPAITITRRAICPSSRARTISRARSSIPSIGRKIWIMPASGWS